MSYKSGYVAILGLPNVGKSTLLNSILKQKLSITNSKPQTTRKRVLGILTSEEYQIIFLDTPGILSPNYLLQEKMIDEIKLSNTDADVILVVIDAGTDLDAQKTFEHKFVKDHVVSSSKNKILIINKIDLADQQKINSALKYFNEKNIFTEVIPVSSELNFNIEKVISAIVDLLPEGPRYYEEDIIATQDERFFVTELIREVIFDRYRDEIPYSCEVLIAEYKEREDSKDYISAEIVVEKDNQKPIIIGKNGAAIKKLGEEARKSIEKFLRREVFLELRVKVRKKWRSNENLLKSFGYRTKE